MRKIGEGNEENDAGEVLDRRRKALDERQEFVHGAYADPHRLHDGPQVVDRARPHEPRDRVVEEEDADADDRDAREA